MFSGRHFLLSLLLVASSLGTSYAEEPPFKVGARSQWPENMVEVTPGHKSPPMGFTPGQRFVWVGVHENNVSFRKWKWTKYGPYDFQGNMRYYSNIQYSGYILAPDRSTIPGPPGPGRSTLTFEVAGGPYTYAFILEDPCSGPQRQSSRIQKKASYRVGAVVNGQKTSPASVPWVFHPDGTLEAPGVWTGRWTDRGDGVLRGVYTCNGVTDDLTITISGDQLLAGKNGEPYRWGTLIQEEDPAPQPQARPPQAEGLAGSMDVWDASENGWTGVWTRRGGSNIFDAVWQKGGSTVKAVLTITVQGNSVNIQRRSSSDGVSDRDYTGTISSDGSVSGLVFLREGGNYPWQGRIRP